MEQEPVRIQHLSDETKSSVVAGVLGVFLGAFGAHDWYLGKIKEAITHVALCVGGVVMLMVGLILTSLFRDIPVLYALFVCILIAAFVIIVGNGIWGFIEGVIIIMQGDAGLAAKGYKIAQPATETIKVGMANTTPVQAGSTPAAPVTEATSKVVSEPKAEAAPAGAAANVAPTTAVDANATTGEQADEAAAMAIINQAASDKVENAPVAPVVERPVETPATEVAEKPTEAATADVAEVAEKPAETTTDAKPVVEQPAETSAEKAPEVVIEPATTEATETTGTTDTTGATTNGN